MLKSIQYNLLSYLLRVEYKTFLNFKYIISLIKWFYYWLDWTVSPIVSTSNPVSKISDTISGTSMSEQITIMKRLPSSQFMIKLQT